MKRLTVEQVILIVLLFALVLGIVGLVTYTETASATVDFGVLLPPATPVQIHLEHGQEFHIFCSADSKDVPDSTLNGILSMESTGGDQWNGNCRPPGTAVDIAP